MERIKIPEKTEIFRKSREFSGQLCLIFTADYLKTKKSGNQKSLR